MSGGISWQELEAIILRLQRTFHRTGKVTKDEKISGCISGRKRQIDICVRTKMGGEEILIVVECKRWNRRVDVKAVEAFVGLKKDVKAHLGIMISTVGFTKAAVKTAHASQINVYKYQDTRKENWPNGLETEAILEIWELTPTRAHLVLQDGTPEEIKSDADIGLMDVRTGEEYNLATAFRKLWESFGPEEKREWTFAYEIPVRVPGRPEIKSIVLGATSKFVRGLKKGRVNFEGLVDESQEEAKVPGMKMTFDGPFTPWPKEKPLPNTQTLAIMLNSVIVQTQDPKMKAMQDMLYNGVFDLTVEGKDVIMLPVRKKTSAVRS